MFGFNTPITFFSLDNAKLAIGFSLPYYYSTNEPRAFSLRKFLPHFQNKLLPIQFFHSHALETITLYISWSCLIINKYINSRMWLRLCPDSPLANWAFLTEKQRFSLGIVKFSTFRFSVDFTNKPSLSCFWPHRSFHHHK